MIHRILDKNSWWPPTRGDITGNHYPNGLMSKKFH